MDSVVARTNGRFRFYFVFLFLPTLGIGSIVLWAWRRNFVYRVGLNGLTLWSGREVSWPQVQSLVTRKRGVGADVKILRLYIEYLDGTAVIAPAWLLNGLELIEAVRAGIRQSRAPGTGVRSHYIQRRK